jgi:hypothetical protein
MMVANFSDEPILIPKATTLGVEEEVSETLIAPIPDEDEISETAFNISKTVENRFAGNQKFLSYLNGKLAHLSRDKRASIEPVLVRFANVFHDDETNDFKSTNVVEHRIETAETRSIRRAPYRVPFALKEEMENQLQNMLKKGVIRESSSPWSAPVILVPKRSLDGRPKYRFCVDFRALNTVTKFDSYPLPLFEQTTSTLAGSKYFSVLDCYSGYWQINIREEDKEKTAFTVPSGHYEVNRTGYGLCNSGASFQRLVDVVLKNMTGTECWVFVDDVIIYSRTAEEQAQCKANVLARFERANLQLQSEKCVFSLDHVQYLGHLCLGKVYTLVPRR